MLKRVLGLILAIALIVPYQTFEVFASENISISEKAEYNGNYYQLFYGAETWEEANKKCEQIGGHLATISSQDENDFLFNLMKSFNCQNAYFGLTDSGKEGKWVWITGEQFSFSNWHSGEPNSENSSEDYAMFYYKFSDGTWNDGDFGGRTFYGDKNYICEWESSFFTKEYHIELLSSYTTFIGETNFAKFVSDTFYEYVDYMYKLGIVNGVGDGIFQPLGEITREQAATILMRTAKVFDIDTSAKDSGFSGVSEWAIEGVNYAVKNGIMNGTGTGFDPEGKFTKEQAIATLVRMLEKI